MKKFIFQFIVGSILWLCVFSLAFAPDSLIHETNCKITYTYLGEWWARISVFLLSGITYCQLFDWSGRIYEWIRKD